MKSASTSPSASPRGARSVGAYMLPLVALPTVLFPQTFSHVGSIVPETRTYGDAFSDEGARLDLRVARQIAVVVKAANVDETYFGDLAFARTPKSVKRLVGRVTRRRRTIEFAESPEDLRGLLDNPGS